MASDRTTQSLWKLVMLLAVASTLAHASVLSPGDMFPPTAIQPGGTLLASLLNQPLTAPTFTGSYSTWVYADPLNTWCVNCLDFVYQFKNNGNDANERFTMGDFSVVKINAGTWPFGPPNRNPDLVTRSLLGNGSVISFLFFPGNEIASGETTESFVIQTNALHFTKGLLSAQDFQSANGVGFQPVPVPEPGSLVLMGGGLLTIGGLLRKKR